MIQELTQEEIVEIVRGTIPNRALVTAIVCRECRKYYTVENWKRLKNGAKNKQCECGGTNWQVRIW